LHKNPSSRSEAHTGRCTDMTKLTGAFCDYTHAHTHLKWIAKKYDGSTWTGFVGSQQEKVPGPGKHSKPSNESSVHYNM